MLSKTLAGLALGAASAEAFAPSPMGMFAGRSVLKERTSFAAQPLVAVPVATRRAAEGAVGLQAAATTTKLPASVKPGVVTGPALLDLINYAKEKKFAMPGVNIVGTNSINACMEAAAKYGGPIMVTFSKGGGQFIAGKTLDNKNDQASIAGTIAGAKHVREVAALYGKKFSSAHPSPIFRGDTTFSRQGAELEHLTGMPVDRSTSWRRPEWDGSAITQAAAPETNCPHWPPGRKTRHNHLSS